MKIQILSDIHNEFSVLPLPHTDADVVVLAGDIDVGFKALDWAQGFKQPVIYVLGNHEFYGLKIDDVRQQMKELSQGSNINFLDDDELILGNSRFLGSTLWTDFEVFGQSQKSKAIQDARYGMNDFRYIQASGYKLRPEDTMRMHQHSLDFINSRLQFEFEGQTIVITHHAPSMLSCAPQYKNDNLTPAFASNLESLFSPKVPLWIHGHMHNSNDYTVNGTRVISNPRGYHRKGKPHSENTDFIPNLVIEIGSSIN